MGWSTAGDVSDDGPADITDTVDGGDAADTSGDCPPGLTECGGECVNTDANHSHCGTCENACEPFEVCSNGGCTLECPPGKIACDWACADIDTDIMNCGGCGIICTAGLNADPVCESRVCSIRCHEGWSDLYGDGACETECVPTSTSETCNGLDDNCDGAIDEEFDCAMGRTVSCTTVCNSLGTGVCGIDCTIPGPSSCNPPAELCNGIDDDCDDACDNGLACCRGQSEECETGCGTMGTRECSATCAWSACSAGTEICNGEDDDCSGECDDGEGMACCMGELGDCTTSCGSTGSRECISSCVWDSCEPPDETCNGEDDDCNGTCDNGFDCCAGEDENWAWFK